MIGEMLHHHAFGQLRIFFEELFIEPVLVIYGILRGVIIQEI